VPGVTSRRGKNPEHHLRSGVFIDGAAARTDRYFARQQGIEGIMATRQDQQIVETPTEARQAEPGPSVLALLSVSLGLVVLLMGVVWFVFFRT
jgi:hypothetical protein